MVYFIFKHFNSQDGTDMTLMSIIEGVGEPDDGGGETRWWGMGWIISIHEEG